MEHVTQAGQSEPHILWATAIGRESHLDAIGADPWTWLEPPGGGDASSCWT